MVQGPFEAGQRVKVHWANDNSTLEGGLVRSLFESSDDLSMQWGNQFVHFWDGAQGTMTYIYGLPDVTIEVLEDAPLFPGPALWEFPLDEQGWFSSESGARALWTEEGNPDGSIWQRVQAGLFGIGMFAPFPLFPAPSAPAQNISIEFDLQIDAGLTGLGAVSLIWLDMLNPDGEASDPIMVPRDGTWTHVDFGPIFTYPFAGGEVPYLPIVYVMPSLTSPAPVRLDNVRLYDVDTGTTIVLPKQPVLGRTGKKDGFRAPDIERDRLIELVLRAFPNALDEGLVDGDPGTR